LLLLPPSLLLQLSISHSHSHSHPLLLLYYQRSRRYYWELISVEDRIWIRIYKRGVPA